MKQHIIDLQHTDLTSFLLPIGNKDRGIDWTIPKWTEVTEPTEVVLENYRLAVRSVRHIVDAHLIRRHQLGGHDLSPLIRFTIKQETAQ